MTNDNSFGQRIAAIWRALIEHLEKQSPAASGALGDINKTAWEGLPK